MTQEEKNAIILLALYHQVDQIQGILENETREDEIIMGNYILESSLSIINELEPEMMKEHPIERPKW